MLSPLAADHVQRPRNVGPLEGATHEGCCGEPGDGPFVKFWLHVEDDTIMKAAYQTHGCPSSIASASVLAQLCTGKDTSWVRQVSPEDLLVILGGLPEGKEKFAGIAVQALRATLETPRGAWS